jgi:hypothetical protein
MSCAPNEIIARVEAYSGLKLADAFSIPDLDREIKWHAKYSRQNGIHSSPSFMIDGLVQPDMGSGDAVSGVTFKWKDTHQRPRPAQDHDTRRRRVHPPLSPPCPAARLAPHPTVRRNGSDPQPHARPPIARHRGERRPTSARQSRENILPTRRYPCCGGRMIIADTFEGARPKQSPLPSRIRIDTS